MGGLPKVTVAYSNGNLLADIAVIDGIAALCGTGSTVGLLGVSKTVYNLDDAIAQGYTEQAEPVAYRHLKEFYAEVGGNQELYVMLVPNTMTMTQMLDDTNASGAKKLLRDSEGRVRLLGVFRKPVAGYNGGANFIDSDVDSALLGSKTFAQARLAELLPLRILIEGRVQNASVANTLTPKTSANGFAGVVLGGTLNDGSASVGTALGRAVKYAAHIKLGKVANGPLSISTCFIGDKVIKEVLNLDTLHDAGFISFMKQPGKAGFYFGIDRMASTDDYRLLAYGRVVDKAALIAAAIGIEELENDTDVSAEGTMNSIDSVALEEKIKQQISVNMGSQISALEVFITSPNLTNTSKVNLKLRVIPKGYTSFIDVDLGLKAPVSA